MMTISSELDRRSSLLTVYHDLELDDEGQNITKLSVPLHSALVHAKNKDLGIGLIFLMFRHRTHGNVFVFC